MYCAAFPICHKLRVAGNEFLFIASLLFPLVSAKKGKSRTFPFVLNGETFAQLHKWVSAIFLKIG